MKQLLFFSLFVISLYGYSQVETEEAAVKQVVNQFFQSLENRDTVLLKQVAMVNGQIWTLVERGMTLKITMRLFQNDISRLTAFPEVKEIPYSFQIHVHEGIAVAWVPYEFRREGEFSHCGVDVFTLMKVDKQWKIVTVAYTVEEEGCEELKNNP